MKLFLLLLCLVPSVVRGQVFAPRADAPPTTGVAGPRPSAAAVFTMDHAALEALLDQAPAQRFDRPLSDYGLAVELPGPSGAMVPCFIANSPVMEPILAAQFSFIRAFVVRSADETANGRIELSPRGLTGMLRTTEGAASGGVWMIDPWQSADPNHVVAYWLGDLPGGGDWVCETTEGVHGLGTPEGHTEDFSDRAVQTLRTVRLAMACNGEYGLYHSTIQGNAPNAADPLAAIVTVVGRANVVYEADLAVHFNLVANNNLLIFFDPATDPYSSTCDGGGGSDCSGNLLGQNISLLASVIGVANFDVGHVVTRIAGGVAYLSAVCNDGFKAGAVSGIPRGGDVDPFSALVVIHELGHQFGANHTFSGSRGRCAGNVRLASAWEAGSGSSPMAYAGACPVGDAAPSDNIVQFAQPFFHHGSVAEMQTFLSTISCPAQSSSGNNIPVITSTTGSTAIPPGTPFVLSANATDADGEPLTYSWEQFDSGVSRPLSGTGSEDNGAGSLFRVFVPTLSPQRTFPKMADVLSGVTTPGERLPTVTGVTRRFRVIVRDNHAGAGGVAISPFVELAIPAGTSSFSVMSPSAGATLPPGPRSVTWTVGGTDAAPISCATVTIRLSTDNGSTFPVVLGTFPNTGSASVTLPAASSTLPARIRVDGDAKIFFAVSGPLALTCRADFNADGFVTGDDFDAYVTAFVAGVISADFNGDGFVTGDDFDGYIVSFEVGC